MQIMLFFLSCRTLFIEEQALFNYITGSSRNPSGVKGNGGTERASI